MESARSLRGSSVTAPLDAMPGREAQGTADDLHATTDAPRFLTTIQPRELRA